MDQWTLSWEFSHFQFVPTPKKSSIYIKIVIFSTSCIGDIVARSTPCSRYTHVWIHFELFYSTTVAFHILFLLLSAMLCLINFLLWTFFFVNHSRHNFLKNEREFIINISGFCWTITSRMFYNLHFISLWCPTFQHDSFSPRYFFIWKIFFTIF